MMNDSRAKSREPARKKLAADYAAFIKRGGQVYQAGLGELTRPYVYTAPKKPAKKGRDEVSD